LILICDTGSTSSNWRLITDNQSVQSLKLKGYNPVFHADAELKDILSSLSEKWGNFPITEVYYYGTGIISLAAKSVIQNGLQDILPNAHIYIHSDLLGAVKVTCGDEPGIVSILGTGSNACMYDGFKIQSLTPSLGYFLGDEGSGCDIGKKLCRDYYYNRMPENIRASMSALLPGPRDVFLDKVKTHPAVNQYLAEFTRVAIEFCKDEYVQSIIQDRFRQFFEYHISAYPKSMNLHAVGSVAFGFREIFNTIASEFGYQVGKVIQKPIEGLILYHQNKKQTW